MVRQLLVPALLALLLVPDWAAAYNPCVCPPPPCQPVVIYGPPVVCCPPTTGAVAPAGPTIVPERMAAPKKQPAEAEPKKEVPAKAEEYAAPKPADPKPEPKKEEAKKEEPRKEEPKKEEKPLPPLGDKIPAPSVPPVPPVKSDLPPFDLVPPIGDLPRPSPEKDEPVKPQPETPKPLPPITPMKEAPKPPDKLPAFDIDLPKPDLPAQPVEANKPVESKKVAVGGERVSEVDVYARDGKPTGAKRGVTFVNKSARDILLTVDGQTTTLPSKTVLTVDLPASFKWQIGAEPEREQTVPSGSSGVDVVIRK
jgi:hypothetical protein